MMTHLKYVLLFTEYIRDTFRSLRYSLKIGAVNINMYPNVLKSHSSLSDYHLNMTLTQTRHSITDLV